jgi:hypothetical protein
MRARLAAMCMAEDRRATWNSLLAGITEQARTQYVLGYISNNMPPPQGIYRKIDVKSGDADQKRRVTHRNGYVQYPAPK